MKNEDQQPVGKLTLEALKLGYEVTHVDATHLNKLADPKTIPHVGEKTEGTQTDDLKSALRVDRASDMHDIAAPQA